MFEFFDRNRRQRKSRPTQVSVDVPLTRWFGPIATISGLLVLAGMIVTGKIDLSSLDKLDGANVSVVAATGVLRAELASEKSNEAIRVASFHIDGFGRAWSAELPTIAPETVANLARVIAPFDVVAISGLNPNDTSPIGDMIDLLRAAGGNYAASISDPIGHNDQIQTYAFVWDENRIHMVPGSVGVVGDQAERMLWEPMYASFETRVRPNDGRRPFRFTLINSWTLPAPPQAYQDSASRAALEVNALDDVFISVRNYGYETAGEEDCVLMGDLGVGFAGLDELGRIPGVVSVSRRPQQVDHAMLDPNYTAEFTGRSGWTDFASELRLTPEQAALISSRRPFWVEFSVDEVVAVPAAASRSRMIR